MILPRNRLIFWTGVVLLPCSLAGAFIQSATAAVVIVLLYFLVIAYDALSAANCLTGIHLTLPEVVRLTKDREACIELSFSNSSARKKQLRIGLPLPPEIISKSDDMSALLPDGAQDSLVQWPCTALKRGRYSISTCYFEGTSELGFWASRGSVKVNSEIRVHPSLMSEHKKLAALFLNRGMAGVHSQRQVGQGREFEKLREYVHGDSYENIHWKATARRGRPITKVYQIERTQEVYIIMDSSRLSARPVIPEPAAQSELSGGPEEILDRFITSALIMGIAAERHGDQFGLLTFSDRVNSFIRAKNGRAHYNSYRDILYHMTPYPVDPDFDELCSFISSRLTKRSLLIFLTNLDDPVIADSFARNMDMIRRKHLVVVNMLVPRGVKPLFSDPEMTSPDDIYSRLGGHIVWHNLHELSEVLKQRGIHFSLLKNENMCADIVSQYAAIKKRQLL